MTIQGVKAKEVLDSRGIPTVQVDLKTNKGTFSAITPSGTSSGKYEAVELRDNNPFRYSGKGVKKAVHNVNTIIAKKLIGRTLDQEQIDSLLIELDATPNKKRLGANALLPVSLAVCRAGAKEHNLPLYSYIQKISKTKKISLPLPLVLLLEGGRHAKKSCDFQEFMVMIKAKTFKDSLAKATKLYTTIKEFFKQNNYQTTVGMEGAFPSPFKDNESPLGLIKYLAKKTKLHSAYAIAIDVASSEFYKKNKYYLQTEKKQYTAAQLASYYTKLIKHYPLAIIEDPFDQDDTKAWKSFTQKNKKINVVGDDFLTTNPQRIKEAIKRKSCNALLVKPNQIGTLTQTFHAISLA